MNSPRDLLRKFGVSIYQDDARSLDFVCELMKLSAIEDLAERGIIPSTIELIKWRTKQAVRLDIEARERFGVTDLLMT